MVPQRTQLLEDMVMAEIKLLNDKIKDLFEQVKIRDCEIKSLKERVTIMESMKKDFHKNDNEYEHISTDKKVTLKKKPNNVSVISCIVCEKMFSKNNELEDHMTEHDNVQKYNCEKCDKSFYLESRLKKHMEMHQNAK